ncbi:Glyoxylase, beta-lactamase superfamily II [Rhizobiales bacterium GAS188]|nr:Glyoxylase, beta-lactamase superfamily II [Rhizobiales bacterium GAS188]
MDLTTSRDIELLTETPPAPGELREVAPNLLWARLPLPMRLNHVNLWFMREDDGWVVVDAGLDTQMCRDAWEKLLAGPLAGRPIRRLVLTHGHPDHVGLAGWLTERFDCSFSATRTEWLFANWRQAQYGRGFGARMQRFFIAHGGSAEIVQSFAAQDAAIERGEFPVPEQLLRLRHGDRPRFGGREFRVIVGRGHADEHASFYAPEGHLLIAGDQILQRITPVIGVFGYEPESDPLSDYLDSLPRFEDLPADTLVLPSHGLPFYGLQARLEQLRGHHQERLDQLLSHMREPRSTFALASLIFDRAMQEGQGRFAFAETLAHLHYAETLGTARRSVDAEGNITFVRI